MDALSFGLVRSIHDPIHKTIRLSNKEMEVIEHPLFRRLHHIRQNSFLYKVFPSAKHTRFEHSLGVMHLAGKMFTAILENGAIAAKRNDIASVEEMLKQLETSNGVGLNLLSKLQGNQLREAFETLRLAALLHDIGHGPLSHLFDAFAPTVDEFLLILESDRELAENGKVLNGLKLMLEKHKDEAQKKGRQADSIRIEHEHVSCYFSFRILSTVKISSEIINNVLTILKPELELGAILVIWEDHQFNLLPLLNDIVASAPIDCDRMDYLLRDSYFAGVTYGYYSEERVLKSMLAYGRKIGTQYVINLGLKQSGIHAIENFLQARYQLYVQVYGHKTNEACNAMLNFVKNNAKISFKEWAKIELTAYEYEELYVSLSDEGFLNKLSDSLEEDYKNTLKRIQTRDLWKRVYEVEEFVEHDNQDTMIKAAFTKHFNLMKEKYNIIEKFEGERFPLKDFKRAAKIIEKTANLAYFVSETPLNKASQIIESLNKGLKVWRIYCPDGDESKVQELKSYSKTHIHPEILGIIRKN